MSKATKTQKPTYSLRYSEGGKQTQFDTASISALEKRLKTLFKNKTHAWAWMDGMLVGAVWCDATQPTQWNWFIDKG